MQLELNKNLLITELKKYNYFSNKIIENLNFEIINLKVENNNFSINSFDNNIFVNSKIEIQNKENIKFDILVDFKLFKNFIENINGDFLKLIYLDKELHLEDQKNEVKYSLKSKNNNNTKLINESAKIKICSIPTEVFNEIIFQIKNYKTLFLSKKNIKEAYKGINLSFEDGIFNLTTSDGVAVLNWNTKMKNENNAKFTIDIDHIDIFNEFKNSDVEISIINTDNNSKKVLLQNKTSKVFITQLIWDFPLERMKKLFESNNQSTKIIFNLNEDVKEKIKSICKNFDEVCIDVNSNSITLFAEEVAKGRQEIKFTKGFKILGTIEKVYKFESAKFKTIFSRFKNEELKIVFATQQNTPNIERIIFANSENSTINFLPQKSEF